MRDFEYFLFNMTYLIYTVSLACYLIYAFNKKVVLARLGFLLVLFASVFHFSDLACRAYVGLFEHQLQWYVPWSNWFETFSLFAFIVGITFVVTQFVYHFHILGIFVVSFLWLILNLSVVSLLFNQWNQLQNLSGIWKSMMMSREVPQMMLTLQSYWMAFHVPAMFIAYAAFAVAFAVGLVYLIREKQMKSKGSSEFSHSLPALEPLEQMIDQLIRWGFPALTLGIILGSRWAYDAWGRYWSWNAKEIWSLVTWFTYAIYLHMRLVMNWHGRKTVVLSIVGFGIVLLTLVSAGYFSTRILH